MAASKQPMTFLLGDQAQRSDTGLANKIFEGALENEQNESNYELF